MQAERWEEWEGTGILFTLAAFGLRMSWSHFFFFFWRGAREVFLWRNSQKRSQTSMRIGAGVVTEAAEVEMLGAVWGKEL